jgi:hypothetical protein
MIRMIVKRAIGTTVVETCWSDLCETLEKAERKEREGKKGS